MTDKDEMLRYDKMVEQALRGVVRQAIEEVVEDGLPGDHHFYITFMTDYAGVSIPDYLRRLTEIASQISGTPAVRIVPIQRPASPCQPVNSCTMYRPSRAHTSSVS